MTTFHCSLLLFLLSRSFITIYGTPTNVQDLEKRELVTCPGFPGYCSEAYPGDTCLVVCAFGRNNVPQCQPNGEWTDVPRCIEHEPGIEEQVTNLCPGIPGYCSASGEGTLCEFDCLTGPDISSFCTADGTWDPYPFCQGDIRETRDGCDGCPGPFGGPRNRTAEALRGGKRPSSKQKSNAMRNFNQNRNAGSNLRKSSGGRRNNVQKNKRKGTSNVGKHRTPNVRSSANRNTSNRKNIRKPSGGVKSRPANFNRLGPNQQRPKSNRNQNKNNTRNKSQSVRPACPGKSLQACMNVCPSTPIKLFGACVAGCARRCLGAN